MVAEKESWISILEADKKNVTVFRNPPLFIPRLAVLITNSAMY